MPIAMLREFLRLEAAGGIVLFVAAAVAMTWVNLPGGETYFALFETPFSIQLGEFGLGKPLLLWINDGLMAVFFLLIGLEVKREAIEGELSSPRKVALPVAAALGGMVVPAVIYLLITIGEPGAARGWAIPAATDIAFALGVLALAGRGVPTSLKTFLLALAIIDDLGAIIIIAVFYTDTLSPFALAGAGVALAVLATLNLTGVRRLAPYVLTGIVLWVLVLKSGVHATLAGVALGLAIPLARRPGEEPDDTPLRRLEHALHPWVAFGILPLFAFANAGVPLAGLAFTSLIAPVPLGIALGLFLGKQIGVVGATWLALKLRLGALPEGATPLQFHGMAVLAGVGFTMSLFIGTLAFPDAAQLGGVRIGVLGGSLLSAIVGLIILRLAPTRAMAADEVEGTAAR
ncbi:MAG: Na+/H+ antiporter NhaA [Alphaproteobacteria bacterium]|nr:Na+/H+ antiporter NhaA [Alphaproteobacteria bacterium]